MSILYRTLLTVRSKPQFLYVAGTNNLISKYDLNGNEVTTENWPQNHGDIIESIVTDSYSNVFIGGENGTGISTRKYNSTGTQLATFDHGGRVYNVDIFSNDDVVTVGDRVSNVCIRKFDNNLTIPNIFNINWIFSFVFSVTVDSNDDFWVTGPRATIPERSISKYNSVGTLLFERYAGSSFGAVEGFIDSTNSFYVCEETVGLRKYSPTGTLLFTLPGTTPSTGKALSDDSFVIGELSIGPNQVKKYSSDGILQWEIGTNNRPVRQIAVDKDDNIYVVNDRPTTGNIVTIFKIDKNGNIIWQIDTGVNVRRCAVSR